VGIVSLIAAFQLNASDARAASSQDWPPFVLVTGLLLIGLMADEDRLFAWAGHQLGRISSNGFVLFLGAAAIIVSVTALLNLDTSVAFLTPVLIYTARSRGGGEAPLLYGCLLLSNAGSLFLPGSNLTNLIVFGTSPVRGAVFLSDMWAPALAAALVTAIVVAMMSRRELKVVVRADEQSVRPIIGVGLVVVIVATVLMLSLRSPAPWVAGVGVAATVNRLVVRKTRIDSIVEVLGAPILVGLFGVAVIFGTIGRTWSGPSVLLSHLGTWPTGALAALGSVLFNNLPVASLVAARPPLHPFALLVGLNLGPNLFVTGSLAWLLWLRTARKAGASPSIGIASRYGAFVVPASMAAALAVLKLKGLH
jgi:arsenical pump membrane protein